MCEPGGKTVLSFPVEANRSETKRILFNSLAAKYFRWPYQSHSRIPAVHRYVLLNRITATTGRRKKFVAECKFPA